MCAGKIIAIQKGYIKSPSQRLIELVEKYPMKVFEKLAFMSDYERKTLSYLLKTRKGE